MDIDMNAQVQEAARILREAGVNAQVAPYPHALEGMLERLHYRAGWTFSLADEDRDQDMDGNVIGSGLTLKILIDCEDSYDPGVRRRVWHYFPVPPATYELRSWRRWLFDQIMKVELHEAMEFFTIDRVKPYAPSHGPGNDPYMLREIGTLEDQRTSFTGQLGPEPRLPDHVE